MDQTSERYLESKEELQRRMDDTRHSMANTMGEIKQELSAAVDWETYIQRYPGTCLLAGGAIGWAIGRRLGCIVRRPDTLLRHSRSLAHPAFGALDCDENGGNGGFVGLRAGAPVIRSEDEAISGRDPHPVRE